MVATSAKAWAARAVGFLERTSVPPEEVEGADGGASQPHRHGVDREEPGPPALGREARPAPVGRRQVGGHHRGPAR